MKYRAIRFIASIVFSAMALISPVSAWAADAVAQSVAVPPVLITEVQTGTYGTGHTVDEFVELYNASDEPIDLTGWQLRVVLATSGTLDAPSTKVVLAPPVDAAGAAIPLQPQSYYVLHTASVAVPDTVVGQAVDSFISSSDKSIVLLSPDNQTCEFVVQDAVAWGAASLGEGTPLAVAGSKEKVLQRRIDGTGAYVDTNNNSVDFTATMLDTATTPNPGTPGQINTVHISPSQMLTPQTLPETRIANKDCTLPEDNPTPLPDPLTPPSTSPPAAVAASDNAATTAATSTAVTQPQMPAQDIGLAAPQIAELLPNPAPPQADAADEFIELYNANDTEFDLSGFTLEVGLTTKHHYVFPAGTMLASRTFHAFFSADTKLSMSNTSGQVRLLDPFDRVIAQSEAYGTAKDGQSWILVDDTWHWTTTPTPNATNVLTTPAVAAKKANTSKQTSSTSASSTKSSSKPTSGSTAADATELAANTTVLTPLHPAILALVGVFALLYGAYEYRHDMANKLYQLRNYRTSRRTSRQGAKGE